MVVRVTIAELRLRCLAAAEVDGQRPRRSAVLMGWCQSLFGSAEMTVVETLEVL
jgi:hypothetical protein